jgi:predicted Zn-dependent peptidase
MRGVNLTCVNAYKFKTGCLAMTFLVPLDKKTVAFNAVLPSVLRRGTSSHPDIESLAATLDELYGARIEPVVRKKGEVQCIGMYADFPDDAFVPGGGRILEKTAKLMGEMLLSPATSGGRLRTEYVESERQNLMDDIRAEINDKRLYASRRMMEQMFKGESYGVSKLGTLSDASKISVAGLTKHYKSLISTAAMEIFYCGAAKPDDVERILKDALAMLPRIGECEIPETRVDTEAFEGKVKYCSEKMDITQGKLVMGYRLGEAMKSPNHAALMVFNAVFGGAVTSKLFMNVREKLSLCYYASSGLDRHKGVMLVSSGIEFSKYDEALGEIEKQLDSIRKGEIEPWEIEGAKKAVMNAIYSSLDEPSGLEGLYLDRSMLGLTANPEELAALVSDITAGEVIKIASCTKLDTVFFLTGEGENA